MACECVSCPECGGSGSVWFSFSGKYIGRNRHDDLDELETCHKCDGSGLSELCDECRDAIEREKEREWIEYEKWRKKKNT